MAEALLGLVFEKLRSMVENELATISGISGKAAKLSDNLQVIRAVVEDAEQKPITDKPIKAWVEQLKNAVHVLDDILDECSIESHRLTKKPINIMFRRKIGNRLKEIAGRFDDIAKLKDNFFLQRKNVQGDEVAEWRQTLPSIYERQVYGREDDQNKILEFLLSQERNSDFLSVYPIVGLGGIGKTTLSRLAYNDAEVSSTFNPRIWICVSENFSVIGILRSVVEFITQEKCDVLSLPVMASKVRVLLQSKRYLLVLDDVWIRNEQMESGLSPDKWEQLKSVLSSGSKGASVLVSTRQLEVAHIMGTCQAHCLQGLSEDCCWSLFKDHAFGVGANNEERAELVAIGKEIAKKCAGSPLVARALGEHLSSKNDQREWVQVKESSLGNLHDEKDILAVLRLSYFHLPPTLRQCFALCAIFPKDTEIIKEEVIYLWMANGFIPSKENMEVEHVGDQIWKELYQKSFFQDVSTNDEGRTTFKMHDIVHDLAQSITMKECVTLNIANMASLSPNTHHVFFANRQREELSFNKGAFKNVESLRTLYQFKVFYSTDKYACLPTHHTLRVFQTSSLNLSLLRSLIHLRYLELYNIEIETLPDSIYRLRKLEILKLKWLRKLICLPKHLTRLQNLRHLVIEECNSLSCMFPNIGKLSCLRTLSLYLVSSKIGHSLAELYDLKLGGKLKIEGLEYVGSISEAEEANLKDKRDLHQLCLSWSIREETTSHADAATNPDEVLEGLQPHSNLMKLRIIGYEGFKSPNWIGMLSNLVDLELVNCSKCVQLSSLGKLPSLRILKLEGMDNMKYIDDDGCYDGVEVRAFPSLEELILKKLAKLERLLKEGKGEMFARLSKLHIDSCPKLELPSCIPSLRSLELIHYTNDLASLPVGILTCLRTLKLFKSTRVKELPEEFLNNFKALEHLEIGWYEELECLPEQGWEGLHSLRTLELYGCRRLRSLPDGIQHLKALEHLDISRCEELECPPEQGWKSFLSLRTLYLSCYSGLRSLLDGIQHLNALENLYIEWAEIECLPEQGWEGLRSLRTLVLYECRQLRSLPDGFRHLTSLESLQICLCPILEERCKMGGEDWDKIRHIPQLVMYP